MQRNLPGKAPARALWGDQLRKADSPRDILIITRSLDTERCALDILPSPDMPLGYSPQAHQTTDQAASEIAFPGAHPQCTFPILLVNPTVSRLRESNRAPPALRASPLRHTAPSVDLTWNFGMSYAICKINRSKTIVPLGAIRPTPLWLATACRRDLPTLPVVCRSEPPPPRRRIHRTGVSQRGEIQIVDSIAAVREIAHERGHIPLTG